MIYKIKDIGEYERSQEMLEEIDFVVDTQRNWESLEKYVQIFYEPKIAIYLCFSEVRFVGCKDFPATKEELLADLVAERLDL